MTQQPGRRERDADARRTAILAAARRQFGADGVDRTTIRSVAAAAEVDPALVMRYFGNKAGLFAAATDFVLPLPDLAALDGPSTARVLMTTFVAVWEADDAFVALLRAAAGSETAADTMREVFADQVVPALAATTPDHHRERAALVTGQLLGLALGRYVLRLPELVELSAEQLAGRIGPVLVHYLHGDLDGPCAPSAWTGPRPTARPSAPGPGRPEG